MENLGVIDRDFWTDRQVLVTGHSGFVGSWLCIFLRELGANVFGYALPPPTTPSLFEDARVADRLAGQMLADILDQQKLIRFVNDSQPEVIFHLAAQPLVLRSYRDPVATWQTNVIGTANLLEAVRQVSSVRTVQIFTSDKCYQNNEQGRPFRETDALGGADPYSASKAAAELVTAAWRSSYWSGDQAPSVATVRAGNIIGGGDWAEDRLVPDCIRALERHQPMKLRAPSSVRPWQHVADALSALIQLAQAQWNEPHRFADAFNVGPAIVDPVSVQKIVDTIEKCWHSESIKIEQSSAKVATNHEAHWLQLDASKIMRMLSWRPRRSVAQAVAETVAWYRRRHQSASAFDAWTECCAAIVCELDVAA